MAQLIDDILRLSGITRADMIMDNINLTEVVQTIGTKIKKDELKRNVKFVISPGISAYGDEKLLSIMMENLLENAWKFTGKIPEAQIEFGVTERDGHKTYYLRDNGVGFDMTYANKLFKPFQRLHTTEEFPGSGIGLASVQRIAQRHGGKVWAEGKVGEGATFYFTLKGE
jgi:light-regulated signal transduction histidine kinase (bacteriophytochrome)